MTLAILALIGVVIGAVFTGGIQFLREEYRYFKERKSLAASISAEIISLIRLIRKRRIHQDLVNWINLLKKENQLSKYTKKGTYSVSITFNYFLIFDSNAGRLGMLGEELAGEITILYTLCKGVAEDLRDQSTTEIYRDGMIYWFLETLSLLEDCIERGLVIRDKLKQISHQGFLEYFFRMLLPG